VLLSTTERTCHGDRTHAALRDDSDTDPDDSENLSLDTIRL
jgi:hypothetical protein